MRILHICTLDSGGAGKAALRLHLGLKSIGVKSKMLVLHRSSSDNDVIEIEKKNNFFNRMWSEMNKRIISSEINTYNKPHVYFSTDRSISRLGKHILIQEADIINLHWISRMVDYSEFFSKTKKKSIVWTLHDANPFTGGCHCFGDCTKYETGCGACPGLRSEDSNDISRKIVERKKKAYQWGNISVITPSRWLRNCAKKSYLLKESKIEVIPNGVPTSVFFKRNRQDSRGLLNLPQNKILILFGSHYRAEWKGFKQLVQSLELLAKRIDTDKIAFVIFGVNQSIDPVMKQALFSVYQLGQIQEESLLSHVYSASDILVLPSLEENFPNVMLESMACGTPVVGFNTGGIPDAVIPNKTGLLAERGDVEDLAKKIEWMINHPKERQAMGENARKLVEQEYNLQTHAKRYLKIYEKLLRP